LPARVAFSFDIGAGFSESFFAAIERIEGPIAMVKVGLPCAILSRLHIELELNENFRKETRP
jgi:hypothetical protein